jgi:LmbE family N-acetylglucosaminyl deacetylase
MIHLNQIAAETPPDHIHAAVAACHAYGTHPIPDNLEDIHFQMLKRESFSEFLRKKGESIASK